MFLIPSLAGGIYSAILIATTAYGPYNDHTYIQADASRSRWAQGGYQMGAIGITVVIAAVMGLIIGVFIRIFTKPMERQDFFCDDAYILKDGKKELQQTKVVKVNG